MKEPGHGWMDPLGASLAGNHPPANQLVMVPVSRQTLLGLDYGMIGPVTVQSAAWSSFVNMEDLPQQKVL